MPRESKRARKAAEWQAMNDKIIAAAAQWPITKQDDPKLSLHKHAHVHGVDHRRLQHYLNGRPLRPEVDKAKSALSPEASNTLIAYIVGQADWGLPLGYDQIRELGDFLMKTVEGHTTWTGFGRDWPARFVKRNAAELGVYTTKSLEAVRANGLTQEHCDNWFTLLQRQIVDQKVPASRIFQMDESGFQISVIVSRKAVGGKNKGKKKKRLHQQSSHNRELITVIACCSAAGEALKPTVIFRGKNCMSSWVRDNTSGMNVGVSEKGYANNVIGICWLELFEAETRHHAPNGEKRILLVDGHSSHLSADGLLFAESKNIELLGYPPHCTHALQGLDVVLFGPLKSAYSAAVQEYEIETGLAVTKDDFITLLRKAWEKVMTEHNIMTAFRKAGAFPVDRNAITPAQVAPAQANSYTAGFPFPTPSPVKAVVAALIPNTPRTPGQQSLLLSSPAPTGSGSAPTTAYQPRRVAHVTPRATPHQSATEQRGHEGRALLRGTSANFLLSHDVTEDQHLASPAYPIPQTSSPDWGLSREQAADSPTKLALLTALAKANRRAAEWRRSCRRAYAYMALQHWHLKRVMKKLAARKKKRNDIRHVIFKGGNGAVLTDPEVIAATQRHDAEQKEKAARKLARAGTAAQGRAKAIAKKAARDRWEKDLADWETERKEQQQQGIKRPTGLRPKPLLCKYIAEVEENGPARTGVVGTAGASATAARGSNTSSSSDSESDNGDESDEE